MIYFVVFVRLCVIGQGSIATFTYTFELLVEFFFLYDAIECQCSLHVLCTVLF